MQLLTTTLWGPSSRFLIQQVIHLSNTTALFRDKDVLWDSAKCFAEIQIDDVCCSTLINQACNPSQKVTTLAGHMCMPSVKSCWLPPLPPYFPYLPFTILLSLYYSLKDTILFYICKALGTGELIIASIVVRLSNNMNIKQSVFFKASY